MALLIPKFTRVWFIGLVVGVGLAAGALEVDPIHRNVLLPPKPENPRNSEGDFIELKDGRVMFVYTHFTGGTSDHATAYLAARFSADDGMTWSADDVTVVPNEGGFNVMSVSLLRALLHAEKLVGRLSAGDAGIVGRGGDVD